MRRVRVRREKSNPYNLVYNKGYKEGYQAQIPVLKEKDKALNHFKGREVSLAKRVKTLEAESYEVRNVVLDKIHEIEHLQVEYKTMQRVINRGINKR